MRGLSLIPKASSHHFVRHLSSKLGFGYIGCRWLLTGATSLSSVAQTSQPRAAHSARIMERHVLQICRSSHPMRGAPDPERGIWSGAPLSFDGWRPDGASLLFPASASTPRSNTIVPGFACSRENVGTILASLGVAFRFLTLAAKRMHRLWAGSTKSRPFFCSPLG
jgi:hypothetical protein